MSTRPTTTHLSADLWESARATRTTIEPGSMSEGLFWEHAHRHRLRFRVGDFWVTERERFEPSEPALIETRMEHQRAGVWALNGALVHVRVEAGRVRASIAADSESVADQALERIRRALPTPTIAPEDPRVAVSFVWKGTHGANWRSRTLTVTPWDTVASNYTESTRERLAELASFRAERPGQTVVWHGEPGTGKSHALRALAYAWRDWCDVEVVTDPDQLFGSEAAYLMEILSMPRNESEDRYRMIVLEDAGELLVRDARRYVGQGLSRFLNVCDGLLGQAEKVLLLVTTNEPLSRLHPAVHRPGRCAAQVEFLPLAADEANEWLASRTELRVEGPTRLCDLYALAGGYEVSPREQRVPVGFARAA